MTEALGDRLHRAVFLPDEESPMGQAVRILLEDAAAEGVSDIHLNPVPEGLEVFYRLDGVLHRKALIDPERSERFIGKIKVLASLLTYRRDVPQDGQIPAAEVGGSTDVRVSIFPTVRGEKAVLRFFLHDDRKFELGRLGLETSLEARLRKAIARPDGVILLTGPSGSGKTTTIYALLREIVSPSSGPLRHVLTLEDPVEHTLPGVTQTQINLSSGLTFASALRSLLRQDPQVIMVGEIRDRETAHVAMEAGLTGHLVISTIHSGTAAGVAVRLLEMGIESHILTSALTCILAQRLVRRRCPGGECPDCHGTGYVGRQAFGELLEVDDALRRVLAGSPTRSAIEEAACAGGMVPLHRAGEMLVQSGSTSEEEVRRVLG